MKVTGYVKSTNGNFCEVVTRRGTACGENCAQCKGNCSQINQLCLAINDISASVGDTVELEMDTLQILKSAFLVYILPLIVFLTVFALVQLNFSQIVSAIAASFSMSLCFLWLRIFDKKHKAEYFPHITQIL